MNKCRKQEGEYKMAKVLLINGSSNEEGCTYTALCEVAGALKKEGIEAEIIQLGKEAIRDLSLIHISEPTRP